MCGKPGKKLIVVNRQPAHAASVPAVFAVRGRFEGREAVGRAAQGLPARSKLRMARTRLKERFNWRASN
jgi:hypothetical protein